MSIEVEKGDDDLFKVFLYEGLVKTQQFCLIENHVHYFLPHNKCVRRQKLPPIFNTGDSCILGQAVGKLATSAALD